MTKPFKELRDKMSPEARAKAEQLAKEMTLDDLVRQLREAVAEISESKATLVVCSPANMAVLLESVTAIQTQAEDTGAELRRVNLELTEAEAEAARLREQVTALEKLAYLGEHHFSDLTYKARLEELVPRLRELEAHAANALVRVNQANDEAARLREQRDDALSELTDKRRQVSALQGGLAEARGMLATADCMTDRYHRERNDAREALRGVKSTARGYLCWCDNSHNNVQHGHQPKCVAATAALGQPAESEPAEPQPPEKGLA